jgi:ribosomal-protein-alanine N-acetyltransferase
LLCNESVVGSSYYDNGEHQLLTSLTITPAQAGDAEWCARLMASIDPWVTLGRKYEDCLVRCTHPEYTLLVARDSGERCGFILLHPRGVAGSPYIASVAVAPQYQGRSIGSELVAEAEHYFPGARHIFLCVSSFNTQARKLYERLGFQRVGELEDYVITGASEILMHKCLQQS